MITRDLRLAGYAAAAAGFVWMTVMAARAGDGGPLLVIADLVVGLAFILAGVLAAGSRLMRLLIVGIGALWLAGSWVPAAELWHQALLAVSLTAFPRGRPSRRILWPVVALAIPLGMGLIPQAGVAVLFFAIAGALIVTAGTHQAGAWYPVSAGLVVGVVLGGSWAYSRIALEAFDPSLALLIYEAVLVVVALGFPFAVRAVVASTARLTDTVVAAGGLAGLDGLGAVLAEVLRDPELRVYRWQSDGTGHRGAPAELPDDRESGWRWLEVADEQKPIGAVRYRSSAMDDMATRDAVTTAVRLALRHQQLEERLETELVNLEAARTRLLAAADRQRQATAGRLREDVVTLLQAAKKELDAMIEGTGRALDNEALAVAAQELARAEDDVAALVAGVPPTLLGEGRLGHAISELAQRSTVPVTTIVEPGTEADADTEAALFYVCSEALTNAAKHSAANRIDIVISGDEESITLRVSDDGRGGADRSGSGLQGLADRLAAQSGRLRVQSPPGAGTTVTAILPR